MAQYVACPSSLWWQSSSWDLHRCLTIVLSRSLPNLNILMPSQLILHTNLFSSFYLYAISSLLFFFPYLAMFSNPVVVSLSSFYRCVIVITYSTSSSKFELLSLRWAIFFSPNLLSHAHLGSSCFFSQFECPQFLSPQWIQRRVLMLYVQMNGICSWIPHGPQPSKLSESATLCWLKLPHPAKATSTPTQSCSYQKFVQSVCKWQHSKFSKWDNFRYIYMKLDKAHFRNMS